VRWSPCASSGVACQTSSVHVAAKASKRSLPAAIRAACSVGLSASAMTPEYSVGGPRAGRGCDARGIARDPSTIIGHSAVITAALRTGDKAELEGFLRRLQQEGRRRLLEVGAGTGQDSVFLAAAGLQVTATDMSPDMVSYWRAKGLDAHVMDLSPAGLPVGHLRRGARDELPPARAERGTARST
jgi:Methyltransferase domain